MKTSTQKSIQFFILLLLALFIPLYPKFPLEEIQGSAVKLRMDDILVAFSLVAWGVFNYKNIHKIFKNTVTQSFFIFWGVGLLSLISAYLITQTVKFDPHQLILKNIGFLHLFRRIEYMSLFFVAASFIHNRAELKIFLKALLIATVLICLYGFGQKYLQFPVISTTNKEFAKGLILTLTNNARPNSTFAGHYDLAAFLSFVLLFCGAYFLYYKKIWEKVVMTVTGILSFALLGLTEARTSFAAALVGLTVIFWMTGKRLLIIALIVASVVAVAAIPDLRHRFVATITVNLLGGGGAKFQADPGQVTIFTRDGSVPVASKAAAIQKALFEATSPATSAAKTSTISADIAPGEPVNSTELGVDRSFKIRLNVEWPRALNALKKNPVLGTGYSSIGDATDNDFLRALGETGTLGFLALALVFVVIGKKILLGLQRAEKFERTFLLASFASLGVLLATAVFIDVLEASKIAYLFWITMGIAWKVSSNYEEEL